MSVFIEKQSKSYEGKSLTASLKLFNGWGKTVASNDIKVFGKEPITNDVKVIYREILQRKNEWKPIESGGFILRLQNNIHTAWIYEFGKMPKGGRPKKEEKPADTPVDKPAKKPIEKPIEKPADTPVDKPVAKKGKPKKVTEPVIEVPTPIETEEKPNGETE